MSTTRTAKKHICFVITSQNQYARSILLLKELERHAGVRLSIVIGGAAALKNYGNVRELLIKDKLTYHAEVQMVIEGGGPLAMSRTAGLAVMEFASVFERLAPDMVVVRGDRYEVLSAAMAAAFLNIPIAHLEGGDVTGTIDESVRHAVTKLSHLHFVTNVEAYERVIRMGEPRKYVFNVGAPEVEYVAEMKREKRTLEHLNETGVGDRIDFSKPYLVVMNHPVTTEYGANKRNTQALLRAVDDLAMQTIWFWPNIDAGTDEISEAIRTFRELEQSRAKMRFLKYIGPEEFITLLSEAAVLVGNSSAGIKEASYLGVPVVNVGTRQNGRLRAHNVIDVPHYGQKSIETAIRAQVAKKRYPPSRLYYKKGSSKRIADIMVKLTPPHQKRFID